MYREKGRKLEIVQSFMRETKKLSISMKMMLLGFMLAKSMMEQA